MNPFHKRQGQMDVNLCYFYTDTIADFKHLLADDSLKLIVISSLQFLVEKGLVTVYGYVIMPNHVHLLWYIKEQNGKENTAASFTKFTAHQFKKQLRNTETLSSYACKQEDRRYQFWKRDPLAVAVTSEAAFLQKLDYIHNNPVREKWKLCRFPEEYLWSSARFYWEGVDEFGILTHYRE